MPLTTIDDTIMPTGEGDLNAGVIAPERLPCLDGIRATAIVLVLFSHSQPTIDATVPTFVDILWRSCGRSGVNLFFGLSGFLITYLLKTELERKGFISLKNFYARRLLRILPAFLAFMAIVIVLNLKEVLHIPWREAFASLFFYRNYISGDFRSEGWYVGHIWTLSLEEQFYLVWPPMIVALGLLTARRVALAVALAMPVIRLAAYYYFNSHVRGQIVSMFHTAVDRILWGALLALYLDHPTVRRAMVFFRSSMWFYAFALFYFVVDPFLVERWAGSYSLPIGVSLEALSVAFAIAWLTSNTGSMVARVLNLPAIAAVGVLSYSLYVWQQPFFYSTVPTPINSFPINLIGACLAGWLSYTVIEKRALLLKTRFRS